MPLELRTERLKIVNCELALIEAELADRQSIASMLDCEIPPSWPPELYDRDALEFFAGWLRANPGQSRWMGWYFVLQPEGLLIGAGGFKGGPADGTVECGYSIVPEHQRNGLGTEAMKALVDWAFQQPKVNRVIADTFPNLTPSRRLLSRLGFLQIGAGSEEGTIRYERWK